MNWRRLWPWLLVLVAAGMWFGWRALQRQSAPPGPGVARPSSATPAAKSAEPIDLVKHDGAAIDFSSGRPVIKNSPADRAAVAQAVHSMDEAAKDVTFQPAAAPSTTTAKPSPPAPAKP